MFTQNKINHDVMKIGRYIGSILSFWQWNLVVVIVSLIASCKDSAGLDVRFSSFDRVETLEGRVVQFPDSLPLVVGAVTAVDDGYWCYLYTNDNYLMSTDSEFIPKAFFAHRGGGPGEVTAVSGPFGEDTGENGLLSVFDYNSATIYGTNAARNYRLEKVAVLDSLRKYSVTKVLRLKNGNYVASKGDFTCGLVEYNPSAGKIKEWPVGFDPENYDIPENKNT